MRKPKKSFLKCKRYEQSYRFTKLTVHELQEKLKNKELTVTEITKEQFFVYERTRMEGKVTMLDLEAVCPLTGLKPEDIKAIQQNFQVLNQKFNKSWKSR